MGQTFRKKLSFYKISIFSKWKTIRKEVIKEKD